MKLKYKILWFDNEPDWVESIEDDIREIIEDEYCFIYDKELREKDEPKASYNNYDLILMDLNLEDEKTGDQLIQNIRDLDVYTDVLFYSADGISTIKEKAQTLGLEGVYFSGRDKDAFIAKLRKVISSTINKVQDLNNIRGLVMAEVSELDIMMENIISKYFVENGNDRKSDEFNQHIISDVEQSTKRKLKSNGCNRQCSHKWKDMSIGEIIHLLDFDSSKKAHTINIIINNERIDYTAQNKSFYEDYKADIIDMRNNLAHCTSELIDGNEVLKLKKEGAKDIVFDADKFKAVRLNIQKYNTFFSRLLLS
ncbi:hypothetical protein [Alistipes finegoldii]|uniref:hypothetical protein n=1 Tax=Alistipes finegoldii TaxID=214856 RepID=UPI003A8F7D55